MKKLYTTFKYFVNFLVFSIVINLLTKVASLSQLVIQRFNLSHSSTDLDSSSINWLLTITTIILLSYMLWLLLKFRKAIYDAKENSIFTKKNSIIFKLVGKGLILYSVFIFILRIVENSLSKVAVLGESTAYNFGRKVGAALGDRIPLLIIAFFLLIVAQLIKEGYQLKDENDLTI
ncbi:MAG: DUF2975 domain-containing protein [Flavobacteriaceae bacterium]